MGLTKLGFVGGLGVLSLTMVPMMCTPADGTAEVQVLAAGVCVYGWPSVPRAVATIHAAESEAPITDEQWAKWAGLASIDADVVPLAEATGSQVDQVLTAAITDILARNNQMLVAVPAEWLLDKIPADDDDAWTTPLSDGRTPTEYISNWLNLYAVDPDVLAAVEAAGVENCADEGRGDDVCVSDGGIEVVLATIRHMESGGDYLAQSPNASASGAYQFVDATWAGYGGYAHAKDAPPSVQDAKAREHVRWIFEHYDHQAGTVPVVWYLPSAYGNDALMDTVPAGNTMTPREYQARWLDRYHIEAAAAGVAPEPCSVVTTPEGEFALPLPRSVLTADKLIRPHHDYPAIDIGVPVGTQLYAPVTGTVVAVFHTTTTWYEPRGGRCSVGECSKCGIGVHIRNPAGWEWSMCHMSRNDLTLGQQVKAGEPIGLSGNTGHSSGPHLHYGIRNQQGKSVCPHQLIQALLSAAAMPTLGSLDDACVAQ